MRNNEVTEVLCHCHKITKKFGKHTALNNVTFGIKKGSNIGIIGRNGCGKTTLLAIIAGLINANSGEIVFQKDSYSLGALIHSPTFFPHLSAYENLNFIARIKNLDNKKARIAELICTFGLPDTKKPYKHFSLGMSQRLAIAAALLGDPDLVILDEPTNGIDPVDIEEIKALIKSSVKPGSSVIVTSHAINDIIDICDHLIVLRSGEIVVNEQIEKLQREATEAGLILKENLIKLL